MANEHSTRLEFDAVRTPERQLKTHFWHKAERTLLLQRLDATLLVWLAATVTVVVLLLFFAVRWIDSMGWLEPPLARPLPDERILMNLRDELPAKPLLDAVYHPPDRSVFISQSGGLIHRYAPETRLWSWERPFADGAPLHPDLIALRSGCGLDWMNEEQQAACPDSGSLWGVSVEGGLARRENGRWSIIVGDTYFVGADGALIEHDDLTAAAVSADRRWLLLGTRANGVGLYDVERRLWQTISPDDMAGLPSLRITHSVWWGDRFWIGGPAGLAWLRTGGFGRQVQPVAVVDGEVTDLDAGPDALWVLERRPCDIGGDDCRRLSRVRSPSDEPEAMLDERNLFPNLGLAGLVFAQEWRDRLVVAGENGVFAYDPLLHNWSQLDDRPVSTALALPTGDGFFFAYSGGVGLVREDRENDILTWSLPGEQTVKLLYGRDNEPLVFTARGSLFALRQSSGSTAVHTVFRRTESAFDPNRFTGGLAHGDYVFLVGSQGVLLHDAARRVYTDIVASDLPDWLLHPDTQLVNAGEMAFAIVDAEPQMRIYAAPTAAMFDDHFLKNDLPDVAPHVAPGPLLRLWSWDALSIGVLNRSGDIYRIDATDVAPQLGPPTSEMASTPLLDALTVDNDLIVATRRGMRRYDGDSRGWDAWLPSPVEATVTEMALWNGSLLGMTENGQLVQMGAGDARLIGDAGGIRISDDNLSDALAAGSKLYLAGDGKIDEYDSDQRRVTARWSPTRSGNVALAAIIDGQPLALVNRRASLGDAVIDGNAGDVLTLSLDGDDLWMARQLGGRRYLKGYRSIASSGVERCFFRTPSAGQGADQIHDARLLSGGNVVAATNGGLRFYSPAARSWYAAADEFNAADSRVYLLEDYLGVASANAGGYRLSFAPLASITFPGTCSASAVSLNWQSYQAKAVAFDEASGRTAWINGDGSLVEWRNGQTRDLLAAAAAAPRAGDIRRVFQRADYLIFAVDNALWSYELEDHRWTQTALRFPSSQNVRIADIDVEPAHNGEIVIVTTSDGDFYYGEYTAPAASVSLRRILTDPHTTFGAEGSALLDVQENRDGYWTFVLHDRIKYYDPENRRWLTDVTIGLPAADDSLDYRVGLSRRVAVADNGREWWIAQATDTPPSRFARYRLPMNESYALDSQGVVWSLNQDGRLYRCAADNGVEYTCVSHLPAPFRLSPDQVEAAWEWQGLVIFALPTGLRAFDQESGGERSLPAEAATFRPLNEARRHQTELWLRSGNRLLILQKRSDSVAARLFSDVERLVMDADGRPWIFVVDQWQYWTGSAFAAPSARPSASPLRVFAAEEQTVTALSENGYPHSWQNGVFARDDYDLPKEIDRAAVNMLVRGSQQDWWVVAGSRLHHVTRGVCYRFAPVRPLAGPTQTPTPGTQTEPPTATPMFDAFGSPLPSATPTHTPSATPTPTLTPTPAPYPCFILTHSFNLSEPAGAFRPETLVAVRASGRGQIDIVDALGNILRLTSSSPDSVDARFLPGDPYRPTSVMDDAWPTLRRYAVSLVGGWSFDPAIALRLDRDGALILERPSRSRELTSQATQTLSLPPALDAGWLRWERTRNAFVVQSPQGPLTYAKDDFAVDGHLLFEPALAVLAGPDSRVEIANRHGVWRFPTTDLGLEEPEILFQPVAWSAPIRAAHGRFLSPVGELALGRNQLANAPRNMSFTLGDVRFVEDLRGRTVAAEVSIGGTAEAAFANQGGFIWDRQRRSVAYLDGRLQMHSAAGIHPFDSFASFDPGPNGLGRSGGSIVVENGGDLHFHAGLNWHVRRGGAWTSAATNPANNRPLLADAHWVWTVQDGALQIDLADVEHRFAFGVQPGGGFGFNADQLLAAAAHQGTLFVATQAFLELADTPDELADLSAVRLPPIATNRLESPRGANGAALLYSTSLGGAVARWNPGTQAFAAVAPGDNPYRRRTVVDAPRLRMTWLPDRVEKELRLDAAAGGSAWAFFGFVQRRFPFDVITSLAVLDDELFIGSAAGLQVYSTGSSVRLADLALLQDMRAPSAVATDPPQAVDRVGVAQDAPSLLMARSRARCLEHQAGAGYAGCRTPTLLDRRLRGQNDLWRWVSAPNGELVGQYRLANGAFDPAALGMESGRFPHDRIADTTICGGQAVVLWQNGWTTHLTDATLRLRSGLTTHAMTTSRLRRLVCLESTVALTRGAPRPGLYAIDADEGVWRYGGSWATLTSRHDAAGVLDYAKRPPILARQRLRLVTPAGQQLFQFEQRTLSGVWQPLPWTSGRTELDDWREVVLVEGGLWVASAAGLIQVDLDAEGRAFVDPDTLVVVRSPQLNGQDCQLTELRQHGAGGSQVVARCNADSSQVFAGELTGQRDVNVFSLFNGGDPFAEETLVDADYWSWRLVNRIGGSRGTMTATRRFAPPNGVGDGQAASPGEDVALTAGRFDFDSVNSLAVFPATAEEAQIATTGAGWYSAPWGTWHVRAWRRPEQQTVEPRRITAVGMTHDGVTPQLCLRTGQGAFVRLASLMGVGQQTQECPEFLGDDGFWQSLASSNEIVMETQKGRGAIRRLLRSGRFTDDRVVGAPTAIQSDDELRLLTPTEAGVLVLDSRLRSTFLYGPPFTGLSPQNSPAALLSFSNGANSHVAYAGAGALYSLEDDKPMLQGVRFDPILGAPNIIFGGAHETIYVGWRENGVRFWLLLQAAQPGNAPGRILPIDVSRFDRYAVGRMKWGGRAPWLQFDIADEHALVAWTDSDRWATIAYPKPLQVHTPLLQEDRLLLVGSEDVLEINLEWALEAAPVMEMEKPGQRPLSTPTLPMATPTATTPTIAAATQPITPTRIQQMGATINVGRLIVRTGPGQHYQPALQPAQPGAEVAAVQLNPGQRVTVIGISVDGDWLKILVPSHNEIGWVFNGRSDGVPWVQPDRDLESLPVIDVSQYAD